MKSNVPKSAIAANDMAAVSRRVPQRELNAEELSPFANYSSYRLRHFARIGIIKACRRDPERHGAWVFQPAAALAEIDAAHRASSALPISVRKSTRK